jgi:arylformamidase
MSEERADAWLDVTVPIRDGMVHWPNDPPVRVVNVRDIAAGDDATVSRLELGAHTGTHVDAPAHFLMGAAGVDQLPLDALVGPARVVHVPDVPIIDAEALERIRPQRGERLLFRTRNSDSGWSSDRFVPDYTHLSFAAARWLVVAGVRTVGIDYLSVGGGGDNAETHRELLRAGVCIIEGLNLAGIDAGAWDLICLPLRLERGDGAPARALLRRR